MTSEAIRDAVTDNLLTPRNSMLAIIDYQPVQVKSIKSMDAGLMLSNAVQATRLARLYGLPIVLSTVNVKTGVNQPTVPELQSVLNDVPSIDRTSINAWEDVEFRQAVEAAGRRKLILMALWTEACLTFPTLDALRGGYEVYPVVDAVGGTSVEAHRAALDRIEQVGAQPTSWVQIACELQRDWARTETAKGFADILFGARPAAQAV
jgi:nicotinamidase-related amidase